MMGSNSRNEILRRLRERPLEGSLLPEVDQARLTRFTDPVAKFQEMLRFVGGESHCVNSVGEVAQRLSELPGFANARQVASLVPEAVRGNVELSKVDDPHDLDSLDWAIVRGAFGVAENGAIWVPGDWLPHRVLLFIPQYLAIVIAQHDVVHHMHEAYTRIGTPNAGFGVFVSGPSKTADIEQSLVLGAHGCRTLQVFLVS